jgi:hypothetical protein
MPFSLRTTIRMIGLLLAQRDRGGSKRAEEGYNR